LLTIQQLLDEHETTVWSEQPAEPSSTGDATLWWALDALAFLLNEYCDLGELQQKSPTGLTVLVEGRAYFSAQGKPRPFLVEKLFLRLDRLHAGLNPDQ
jgi:hypothetical protein